MSTRHGPIQAILVLTVLTLTAASCGSMAGQGRRPSAEDRAEMESRRAQMDSLRAPPPPRAFALSYDQALENAARTNRRVLVAWVPADTAAASALRFALRQERQVAGKVSWEYETVWADAEQRRSEPSLAELWRTERDTLTSGAGPALTALDGEGAVLGRLEGSLDPRILFGFLLGHQAPYPDMAAELERVQQEAKDTDRLYFEYFVDQPCEPCDLLETWLARPAVAEVWERVFVNLRVDVSRSLNGGALLAAEMGMRTRPIGFPFFVIKRSSGRSVGDSRIMPEKENVGFPWTDEEITTFEAWLERRVKAFTPDDRQLLTGEILKMREELEGGR